MPPWRSTNKLLINKYGPAYFANAIDTNSIKAYVKFRKSRLEQISLTQCCRLSVAPYRDTWVVPREASIELHGQAVAIGQRNDAGHHDELLGAPRITSIAVYQKEQIMYENSSDQSMYCR